MTRGLQTWIDESVHVQGAGRGFYVLAAAVGDRAACEPIREVLRALVPRPRRRLHWNAEDEKTRQAIARAVARMDLSHVVVVGPAEASKQERARRKCMERLLFELDGLGVGQVWIEARQVAQNRRDQAMVAALVGIGVIPRSLQVDFAAPLEEPMLWVPDAVAGMTGLVRRTGDGAWVERLGDSYRLITV